MPNEIQDYIYELQIIDNIFSEDSVQKEKILSKIVVDKSISHTNDIKIRKVISSPYASINTIPLDYYLRILKKILRSFHIWFHFIMKKKCNLFSLL